MCTCQKDQDGRCQDCASDTAEALKQYIQSNFIFAKQLSLICSDCRKATADWSMAKVLRDLVSKDPDMLDFASAAIGGFVQSAGLPTTPLLDAELKKFARQKAQREDGGSEHPA